MQFTSFCVRCAFLVVTLDGQSVLAQNRNNVNDISYNLTMPSGCSGVRQVASNQFILEECSRSGTINVRPATTTRIGKGVAKLTFTGQHSGHSGYYCSDMAPGLPPVSSSWGGRHTRLVCTASGWQAK